MIAETFVGWLQSLGRGIRPWVTVKPWEQGVRVRRGKVATLLPPGMHLKIPIIDSALVYAIRKRTAYVNLQTLRSKDNRTVTIGLVIVYQIADLLTALSKLHNPEGTLIHLAQGAVSTLVNDTDAKDLKPGMITEHVLKVVQPEQYGIADFEVLVSDNADLSSRTFRLLNEGRYTDHASAIDDLGREG